MWANLILLGALISTSMLPSPAAEVRPAALPAYYAGWAMEAYPEQSAADMEIMVRRVTRAGANVVWIGHNNPGEVDPAKVEPGLSYAVYEAYLDPADPRHEAAVAMVEAQHRMLAACRAVSVKAVLPVGYQIQMGAGWNSRHPDSLRLDAKGRPLDIFGGGVSASFYAPAYRRDIAAYYRWIDAEFVRPYDDLLMMLNLADEPIGGDYSSSAEAEFRRRYGFDFAGVGDDPQRQRLLGEFQSRYVVEYAAFSAGLWRDIHPDLPVTMSFDGAQARLAFTLPDVEALFRDTPSNFVVTFDAYPRDGLPNVALSDGDLNGLFLLARSVGLYSARYGKPVWLWAAANRWGLSQASSDPGTVSDAVANGLYLALLVRQGGGDLRGIAYWNYNVKEQGLYNDTHPTAYDIETMFARVSVALPTLRRLMAAPAQRPDVLVLAPPAAAYQRIGAAREAVRLEGQPFPRLAILAKENVNTAVVDSLRGWSLERVKAVVVVSPGSEYLHPGDLDALRGWLAQGGKLVTSRGVAQALLDANHGEPDRTWDGLAERWGSLYVAQQGVPVLFEDDRHELLAGFWQELLGLETAQPGYRVIGPTAALYYHRGPDPVRVSLSPPLNAAGYRYDAQARSVERLRGAAIAAVLGRREYLFVTVVPSRPSRR
ncbi:MAG: hypothetical protein JXM73_01140 [Anaerolineae bacterium]|nr:hypothetical protein [Anaerolineae bacterium]